MKNENRIVIPVTPKTPASVTQDTFKIFHIPEVCQARHRVTGDPDDKGLSCDEYLSGNIFCGHTLSKHGRYKKKAIEKYNDYKVAILTHARRMGFTLPAYGWSVYFYIPIPKRWSPQDRIRMHGQPHHKKPDLDNLYKAVTDALIPNDEVIAQLSGWGKFWVDTKSGNGKEAVYGPGYIEILYGQPVYNPFGIEYIDQSQVPSLRKESDIYKKRKKQEGKKKYHNFGNSKKSKTDELK